MPYARQSCSGSCQHSAAPGTHPLRLNHCPLLLRPLSSCTQQPDTGASKSLGRQARMHFPHTGKSYFALFSFLFAVCKLQSRSKGPSHSLCLNGSKTVPVKTGVAETEPSKMKMYHFHRLLFQTKPPVLLWSLTCHNIRVSGFTKPQSRLASFYNKKDKRHLIIPDS